MITFIIHKKEKAITFLITAFYYVSIVKEQTRLFFILSTLIVQFDPVLLINHHIDNRQSKDHLPISGKSKRPLTLAVLTRIAIMS